MHTIETMVAAVAQGSPEAPAILAPDRMPLSYQQLASHLGAMVSRLSELGVGRGDRVAIVLPNGPEMALAFLAVASAATSAPLNPAYRAAEFDYYLADLEAQALLVLADDESAAVEVARARHIPIIEMSPTPDGPAGTGTLSGTVDLRMPPVCPARPDDVALVLHTSGTTSRPKLVPLTHINLCASAMSIHQTLCLSPADRCLNVMPLFHIHGLAAALLASLSAGASVACTPGFYAPMFFPWLEHCQPTWYTAVPTMHQSILARAAQAEAPVRTHLRLIRSSSAALPPSVMADLERVFGVPVIEAYGMTEAAHQMASNPLPPRTRKAGSVGVAAGPQVAVMAEDEKRRLAPMQTGEIVIRGESVMLGYADNPDANARAFTDGWFRTGDQGHIDPDGYIYVTGRLKEIINRGGEKISPGEIDQVLIEHPAVVQAVAFAVPDARLGEDIAAAVVLSRPGATELDLRRYASTRLAPFKVPRRILIVDEIPKGPTGKIQRIGMAERLSVTLDPVGAASARGPLVPPRTDAERFLAGIWCEVLGLSEVSIHDPFLDLGGDSILATRLVTRICRMLGIDLALIDLFEAPTIAEQGVLIEERLLSAIEAMSEEDAARTAADEARSMSNE